MVFFSRQFRAQISSTDIPCKTFRFLSNYVVNQEHDCTLIALSYLSSLSSQNSRKKIQNKRFTSLTAALYAHLINLGTIKIQYNKKVANTIIR